MKGQYYNFLIYRLLSFLMALNVINLSVGIRNTEPLTNRTVAYHEDLSVNKIESISEFLLEECFGLYDAVPEHDDSDDESELTELEQDYDFAPLFTFAPILVAVHYLLTENIPFRTESIPVHIQEIIAPPPQMPA